MNNNQLFQTAKQLNSLYSVLGDYAPKMRTFITDYKGPDGGDYNQMLIAWQPRGMGDDVLITHIRQEIEKAGNTVSCISEIVSDTVIIRYISPEVLAELLANNQDDAQ